MSAPSPACIQAATRRRTSYSDLRISDAERAEVADLLSKHYGDGRLDQAEFNERLDQAMKAKTYSDLYEQWQKRNVPKLRSAAVLGAAGALSSSPREPYAGRRTPTQVLSQFRRGLLLLLPARLPFGERGFLGLDGFFGGHDRLGPQAVRNIGYVIGK